MYFTFRFFFSNFIFKLIKKKSSFLNLFMHVRTCVNFHVWFFHVDFETLHSDSFKLNKRFKELNWSATKALLKVESKTQSIRVLSVHQFAIIFTLPEHAHAFSVSILTVFTTRTCQSKTVSIWTVGHFIFLLEFLRQIIITIRWKIDWVTILLCSKKKLLRS